MIPLEIITMLGSGLLGGLMTVWSKSLEAKKLQRELVQQALSGSRKAWQEARQHSSPVAQVTRRTVTIASVLAIIVLPKLAALISPETLVVVGYTEWNPGFLFFTEGHNEVHWRTAKGLVITPLDTHMVSAIVGFYFGHRVGK